VFQSEFSEFAKDDDTGESSLWKDTISNSLVRLNGIPVNPHAALVRGSTSSDTTTGMAKAMSPDAPLKNMDVVSRMVHWHEAPVIVPPLITVTKVRLPQVVLDEFLSPSNGDDDNEEDVDNKNSNDSIFFCDKPTTVPVHPAGPYLSNTLTFMVEAQEKMEPRSLFPCHRLDRCTSGLMICCTSSKVARLLQVQLNAKNVDKLYLARVAGRFPYSTTEAALINRTISKSASWIHLKNPNNCIEVNTPIGIGDVKLGTRAVVDDDDTTGKASRSRFQFLAYDEGSNTSMISCCPLTGRGHQLRVHLQWLGFPIHGDVQYGNTSKPRDKDMRDKSIEAIYNSIQHEQLHPVSCLEVEGGFDTNSAKQCRDVCRCCSGGRSGIIKSFSAAQLLEAGHAIDLHAWKYRIRFQGRSSKRKKEKAGSTDSIRTESDGPIADMMLQTAKPAWAKSGCFGDTNYVQWLQ